MSTQNAYNVLAEKLGYPKSERFRAVLNHILTPDQAQMAAALPGTSEEVAENTGFDAGSVKEELETLFRDGVVIPKGDFNNREIYRFPRSVGQLWEASQSSLMRDIEKDAEFYKVWHEFTMEEWYPDEAKRLAGAPVPSQRVVPSHLALEGLTDVLPCEDYRELLKAQDLIASVPCACRYQMDSVGEPCEHTRENEQLACFLFARGAEYAIARGSGRKVSIDEALELVEGAAEKGLLHMWPNSASTKTNVSCNCCRDCCMMYVPLDMIGASIGTAWAKSRYEAFIEQDKCDGCQDCVERCQFDAIDMVKPETPVKKKGAKKLKALVDSEKCWGCGVCVPACDEAKAIGFKVVRPVEHIPTPA